MAIDRIIRICISLVWLVNGLYCKLLGLVPRHQQIVARILGGQYAVPITKAIGALEILMAIWVLSKIKPRLCAISQVMIVAAMNIIESILAPDLLLFGYLNMLVALVFVTVVLLNEFYLPAAIARKK